GSSEALHLKETARVFNLAWCVLGSTGGHAGGYLNSAQLVEVTAYCFMARGDCTVGDNHRETPPVTRVYLSLPKSVDPKDVIRSPSDLPWWPFLSPCCLSGRKDAVISGPSPVFPQQSVLSIFHRTVVTHCDHRYGRRGIKASKAMQQLWVPTVGLANLSTPSASIGIMKKQHGGKLWCGAGTTPPCPPHNCLAWH
ncbi:hypothetical protein CRENBAI_020222, partial [Crenichthys baileyi]